MVNNYKRLICLSLAVAMILSLVGCKTVTDNGSSNVEYIVKEEYVYVDAESSDADNSDNAADQQSSVNSENNSSVQQSTDVSSKEPGVDPADYSGTTVKFAVTSDPKYSEKQAVIEAFQEKYNINIEPVIIQGDFITELTKLIASGESPDVVRSSGDFPLSLSYLQSLDAAKLDYSDPIWEQGMFEMSTFGGSPYLCTTVGNVYTETDIVIYRKDILEKAKCKTPEQYDAEGNWNMDAFFEIARQCVQKVEGVKGCSFVNYDSALHMTGNSVFKYENGKYVNGMTDSVVDVFSKLSEVKKEGILTVDSTNGIVNGTVAIATHHSYALRKTGAYFNNKEIWSKLGYYYLPSYSDSTRNLKTGIFRGWGIVKGSQNPVAAGIFLRYYLDYGNFDVQDMYISSDAATFFMKATDIDYDNWNPYFTYGENNEEIAGIDFYDDIYSLYSLGSSQIQTKISSVNNKINKGCDNINNYIIQELASN